MLTREIPLTQGKVAIVDADDYEWLTQWKWSFNKGYAKRGGRINYKQYHVLMHRLIAQTPAGVDTDHINRNKLDNRRCNLRACSRTLNCLNRDKQSNNTVGFKGVTFHKSNRKFQAQIGSGRKGYSKKRHLGYFKTPQEAYQAYLVAEKSRMEVACYA